MFRERQIGLQGFKDVWHSRTTLRDRKLGNQPVSDDCVSSYGRPLLFTQAEEKRLAEHIVYMARI